MLLGYMRVSKADGSQVLDLQRDALLAAEVAPDRCYEDLASGRYDARPGLEACLKALRPGDTLVVWKLDRLGRNLRHLVTVVEDLRQRDVGFKVLTGQGPRSIPPRPMAGWCLGSLRRWPSLRRNSSASGPAPVLRPPALGVGTAAARGR